MNEMRIKIGRRTWLAALPGALAIVILVLLAEGIAGGAGAVERMLSSAFLPVLGSAITIALGLMRSNVIITFIAITLGKLFRYIILIYGAGLFI